MRTAKVVPVTVAPDDPHARAVGDAVDKAFRSQIGALVALATVPPQPRWLFRDIADGKSMSASQLFRAFAICATCRDIPTERVHAVAETLVVLLRSVRPEGEASLEALHLEETRAQADADVLQLQATVSGGKDRVAVERALDATARHQAVTVRYASALAARLTVAPSERPVRVVRQTRCVASTAR